MSNEKAQGKDAMGNGRVKVREKLATVVGAVPAWMLIAWTALCAYWFARSVFRAWAVPASEWDFWIWSDLLLYTCGLIFFLTLTVVKLTAGRKN
jgi:hypothetical protein